MFDCKDETDETILRACKRLWERGQNAKSEKAYGSVTVELLFAAGDVKTISHSGKRTEQ
jgi:hypothetical protein